MAETTIEAEADRVFIAVNNVARLMNATFKLDPEKLACIREGGKS